MSEIQLPQPARSTLGFSELGIHAVPLLAAVAIGRLIGGSSAVPWPPCERDEVYRYLKRRIAGRVRAVHNNLGLYVTDLAAAAFAFWLATLVRLGLEGQTTNPQSFEALFFAAPWFVGTAALVLPFTCAYTRNWRYATVPDLVGILRAAVVVSLIFVFALFAATRLASIPRSVLVIAPLFLLPLLIAPRIHFKAGGGRMESLAARRGRIPGSDMVPVLLIGAGDAADAYLRGLERDPTARHFPVGLLDPQQAAEDLLLRGVPVLGTIADFDRVIATLERQGQKPRHLIFTDMGSGFADPAIEALIARADALGIATSRPSPVLELRKPKSENRFELRPIELTDLLERPQAALDKAALTRMIRGCRVAVTGAGGSIGSELVLQIAALQPAEIVLVESSEYNLYAIDMELSEKFSGISRAACLGNVRDAARLDEIFARHRPELVFHAAALKHVPMVELNPCEGVLTNVIGTMNVAEATRRCGARAMVQISTDKVVNATNVMGATKRLAELYCQALDLAALEDGGAMRFMTTRFGNVLGSSGSLIPLFKRQLARGGPLTVTHPEMKRFFMTIREAVELTLQASAYGLEKSLGQGEIFVLDMGEPIKIIDMARRMIRLAGLEPGRDVEIRIVGLRPGEKLFEELFDEAEKRVPSPVPGVLGAVPNAVPLDALRAAFATLRTHAERGEAETVTRLIAEILPSYRRPGIAPPNGAQPSRLAVEVEAKNTPSLHLDAAPGGFGRLPAGEGAR